MLDLDLPIARATARLWSLQRDDGTWDFPGEVGPVITAQVLVALRYVGSLPDDVAARAAAHLAEEQRPDGGFPAYPGAPKGDLGATVTAWAALADVDVASAARARAWIDAHGGDAAVVRIWGSGDFGPLFAAMAGRLDARQLRIPPVRALGWKAARPWLERRVNAFVLNLVAEAHLLLSRLVGAPPEPAARAFADAYYADFQNADGSVNELPMQTAMLLATLHGAGEADRTDRARAWLLAQIGDGSGFSKFSSEVWATTHAAHALLRAGAPAEDPRLVRTWRWLVDARCSDRQVERLNPGPRRVRRGGWAYQKANVRLPDTDDTAVVVALLGEVAASDERMEAADRARVRAAFFEGARWLEDMQNPDGGWAAFTRGMRGKVPGHGPTGPLEPDLRQLDALRRAWRALGDPSTEGLTGRCLIALAATGARHGDPEVDAALAFVESQQADHGGFWGRWFVNYLPTTAWVLMGAAAVGAPLDRPWVKKAIDFVLAHQRDDGGWGEDAETYTDPSRAGEGPRSMAGLTGIVTCALIEVGLADHPAVQRAARWLVAAQRADGTWDDGGWLAPYLPPSLFYRYPGSTLYAPLDALCRLRDAGRRREAPSWVRHRRPDSLSYGFVDVFDFDAPIERIWAVLADPASLPGGTFLACDAPALLANTRDTDLEGHGMWLLVANGGGTRVTFVERVVPNKRPVRWFTRAARPLFRWNHDRAIERAMVDLARQAGGRAVRVV